MQALSAAGKVGPILTDAAASAACIGRAAAIFID